MHRLGRQRLHGVLPALRGKVAIIPEPARPELGEDIIGRTPRKHLNRTVSLPFLTSRPCTLNPVKRGTSNEPFPPSRLRLLRWIGEELGDTSADPPPSRDREPKPLVR